MAELSLPAPPQLIVDITSTSMQKTWDSWINTLEVYFIASNIQAADRKRALLLYLGGEELRTIHRNLGDNQNDYDFTKGLLETYFKPFKNATFERYKFYSENQSNNETTVSYVTRLKDLSRNCEFATYSIDKALVDQVINKCTSNKLRRRLLRESELTLENLLKIATAVESAESQAVEMEKSDDHLNRLNQRETLYKRKSDSENKYANEQKYKQCYGCGSDKHFHASKNCPAKGKRCSFCKARNHFSAVCIKRTAEGNDEKEKINTAGAAEDDDEGNLLHEQRGTIKSAALSDSDDDWVFCLATNGSKNDVVVKLDDHKVSFMVDSGASVNIIDSETFNTLTEKMNIVLKPSASRIFTYGSDRPMALKGEFVSNLRCGHNLHIAKIHVSQSVHSGCLLGRSSATALGLLQIHTVNSVEQTDTRTSSLLSQFPQLTTGFGKLKDVEIKLDVDDKVKPVVQHLRKVPFHVRKKVEEKIEELINLGVIEPVKEATTWISPLLAVPKGDDIRIVVDMRQPNTAIRRTHHPIPTTDEILSKFKNCKVFSKIDLRNGYMQIQTDKDSRHLTTFSSHKGLFRFKRLVPGTNAASELYQYEIGQLFKDEELIANISDDIILGGVDQDHHYQVLRKCFQILSDNNLTINLKKCLFGVSEIPFFGLKISAKGIKPMCDKIEAVKNFNAPTNAKEVRSFLGFVNFLAKFIPNLSSHTEILRKLTHKDVKWEWGEVQQQSFDYLKGVVCSPYTLAHFDQSKETQLIVDAGPSGIGAILAQKQSDNTVRPIHFASKSLTSAEKNYSQIEKEALAVLWGCKRFHLYLYGAAFTVLTDHKPLEVLYSPQGKPSARILRWAIDLQQYDFSIKHIPGLNNPADILSRQPTNKINDSIASQDKEDSSETEFFINSIIANSTPRAITFSELLDASSKDKTLLKVRKCLKKNSWPKDESLRKFFLVRNQLTYKSDIILKDSKIVIPESLRCRTLILAHEGHQGMTKTKLLLRSKVWWPGMDRQVEQEVRTCIPCLSTNTNSKPEPLIPTAMPDPWEVLHIDIYGPLPCGTSMLGIIDSSSRWPVIHFLNSTTSAAVAERLNKTFTSYGYPSRIVTDNAPNLTSAEVTDFCKIYGIEHQKICPYWPQANSEIERFYRTLGNAIKRLHAEGKDWKKEIHYFIFQYRTTPHSGTGATPAKLLMGRELRGKIPMMPEKRPTFLKKAKANDKHYKDKMKKYHDTHFKAKHSEINVGDVVLLRQKYQNKLSTKFDVKPFKVLLKKGTVLIIERNGKKLMRNSNLLKKVCTKSIQNYMDNNSDDELEFNITPSQPQPQRNDDNEGNEILQQPQFLRRSQRTRDARQLPVRYNDYHVTYR